MPCHIHHGPPGSFKSCGVIQDEVIPALEQGRTVVTNIRGLDSLEQIESVLGIELHEDAELINVAHNAQGDIRMRHFYHWVPHKALIVIDELQRIYSKKERNLRQYDYPEGQEAAEAANRPFSVENTFDQHRHFGWDIFCTTPNIAKVHPDVREVAEYAFRHRDVSGLLPWWKNRWKEVQHTPDNSGQSQSHAIGKPVLRKADSRYFNIYRSVAIDSAEKQVYKTKNIFKQPKMLGCFAFIAAAIGYQIYYWSAKFSPDEPTEESREVVSIQDIAPTVRPATTLVSNQSTQNVYSVSSWLIQQFRNQQVYSIGEFPQGPTYKIGEFTLTDFDLANLGASIEKINLCFQVITIQQESFYVTCPEPNHSLPLAQENAQPTTPVFGF